MSDPNTPVPTSASSAPAGAIDQKEIDDGKVLAALCYVPLFLVGLIVSIVMLVVRNNSFSLHHAKQALTLYICWIVIFIPLYIVVILITVVGGAATARAGGVGLCIGPVLMLSVGLAFLVVCILGLVNAFQGKQKDLPVIGGLANKMFGSIKKKTA